MTQAALTVHDILRTTADDGGGTWRPRWEGYSGSLTFDTVDMPTGYVVGGIVPTLRISHDWLSRAGAQAIGAFCLKHRQTLQAGGHYIGTWRDSDDGSLHVDAVQVIADLATALDVARQRGELAIWDVAAGREIRTGGTFPTDSALRGKVQS